MRPAGFGLIGGAFIAVCIYSYLHLSGGIWIWPAFLGVTGSFLAQAGRDSDE